MYGTVARMTFKPDGLDEFIKIWDEWNRDAKPSVEGVVAGYVYQLDADPNQAIMAVVYRDKAAYMANADDPEQDKWYRRMRECMTADPEWNDGKIVAAD